jgi:AraC family transcriptional regulator, melibiose operon regulatory protein
MKVFPSTSGTLSKFGFSCHWGKGELITNLHSHNEVELIFVKNAPLTYFFSNGQYTVLPGTMAIFWALTPHRITAVHNSTYTYFLNIPFAWFTKWQLPKSLSQPILNSRFIRDPEKNRSDFDDYLFRQWYKDINSRSEDRHTTTLTEIEGRLRRLALYLTPASHAEKNQPGHVDPVVLNKAEKMALFIAENFTHPLRVKQIADAVDLNQIYAVRLFRRTFGMTLIDYITEQRISYAQRLLLTSDAKILDIAMEAGFESISRFYAVFNMVCKCSPAKYRHSPMQSDQ